MRHPGIDEVETTILKRCKTSNAVISKLRGLPKRHKLKDPKKDKFKMRPIISCMNCPIYKLSQFIGSTLKNSFSGEAYNIVNSYQFSEFIVKQSIPTGYKFLSLDVTSLFTNVPMDLVKQLIVTKWSAVQNHTSLTKELFISLLEFCLSKNYFPFNGEFYEQLDGSGMGVPMSPTLTSIVMEHVVEEALKDLEFLVLFFKIYVDDCVTCIPADKIDIVLTSFNRIHPKIQFTHEIETNSKLAFLDMKLIHNPDGSISAQWNKKSYASGRLLNYNSCHPIGQKISTAYGLINRVITLTTKPSAIDHTISQISWCL